MKKLKSALLSLMVISSFGVVFDPPQVRADSEGPQNTSSSQSGGGQSSTDLIIRIVIRALGW
ncbi:MAG: hypothetical protein DMF61_11380 [Blastocatellia bacterium AA13]|nr:MAG: hypothetical protein DMF61_11380 [Blastocatellia bacterium AA13]